MARFGRRGDASYGGNGGYRSSYRRPRSYGPPAAHARPITDGHFPEYRPTNITDIPVPPPVPYIPTANKASLPDIGFRVVIFIVVVACLVVGVRTPLVKKKAEDGTSSLQASEGAQDDAVQLQESSGYGSGERAELGPTITTEQSTVQPQELASGYGSGERTELGPTMTTEQSAVELQNDTAMLIVANTSEPSYIPHHQSDSHTITQMSVGTQGTGSTSALPIAPAYGHMQPPESSNSTLAAEAPDVESQSHNSPADMHTDAPTGTSASHANFS
ncbi:hypothetical protein BU26DRAFT_509178 [Trematosphaeria pertusa]|uniref:Uncharacterized protein n=1 Tax=Trematosphaeria pertusa TaxID=390896 RepID=A0A6A6I1U0_9PLEO|nr:uncharacterized protein BU26DRAFT_509178 [Trematosphaeria pertusa]KAF2244247.1 hypothetical protein BU26DRAFT_509178 [Trematosphaeria pertusa]